MVSHDFFDEQNNNTLFLSIITVSKHNAIRPSGSSAEFKIWDNSCRGGHVLLLFELLVFLLLLFRVVAVEVVVVFLLFKVVVTCELFLLLLMELLLRVGVGKRRL